MKTERRALTVASRLYRLVGGFIAVVAISGAICFQTVSRLRVNGAVYARIVEQKDLLADILPPPMYVIETYLTALQMVGEADPAALKEEVDKIHSLKKDFTDRTEF